MQWIHPRPLLTHFFLKMLFSSFITGWVTRFYIRTCHLHHVVAKKYCSQRYNMAIHIICTEKGVINSSLSFLVTAFFKECFNSGFCRGIRRKRMNPFDKTEKVRNIKSFTEAFRALFSGQHHFQWCVDTPARFPDVCEVMCGQVQRLASFCYQKNKASAILKSQTIDSSIKNC